MKADSKKNVVGLRSVAAAFASVVAIAVCWSILPGVALAAPINTGAPVISGTLQVGQPLTVSPGTWITTDPDPATITYSYAWTSDGDAVGSDSPSYTVAAQDIGQEIGVTVTATDSTGSATAPPVSAGRVPTPPQNTAPPVNTARPRISGTPQQGQTLTVTPGTWTNNPTSITDHWQSCSGRVCRSTGQTGSTYTPGAGDVGHTIEVVETAANAARPATSRRTATVTAASRTTPATTTSRTSVVVVSPTAPTTNQAVTLVATVSSSSPNANPHGSMSFFNGADAIEGCSGKAVNGDQTVTVICQALFPAGTAQISAAYARDSSSPVAGSQSAPVAVTVGKGETSVALAVPKKVAPGGRARYLATIAVPVSNSGPILPTGSVRFLDRGRPISACINQPLSNLTATCSVRYKSRGTHRISAVYNGDANFNASNSSAKRVQVMKGAPKAARVLGALGSTLGWTFYYHPAYSELSIFRAFAIPRGTSILIQCHGTGCPYAKLRLAKYGSSVNLLLRFRHRHLRAGTRISVGLTRRRWVGKYYSFTIRAGRPPLIKKACLAPGGKTPVRCPTGSTGH